MTIESINYQSADVEDFEKIDCRIIGNPKTTKTMSRQMSIKDKICRQFFLREPLLVAGKGGHAFYLSEQITVASCTGQSQCQDIFFDFINQQPIRQDMAFTESNVISG